MLHKPHSDLLASSCNNYICLISLGLKVCLHCRLNLLQEFIRLFYFNVSFKSLKIFNSLEVMVFILVWKLINHFRFSKLTVSSVCNYVGSIQLLYNKKLWQRGTLADSRPIVKLKLSKISSFLNINCIWLRNIFINIFSGALQFGHLIKLYIFLKWSEPAFAKF